MNPYIGSTPGTSLIRTLQFRVLYGELTMHTIVLCTGTVGIPAVCHMFVHCNHSKFECLIDILKNNSKFSA